MGQDQERVLKDYDGEGGDASRNDTTRLIAHSLYGLLSRTRRNE
jgi:hypothetical protein